MITLEQPVSKKIVAVIAAYNEERFIGSVILKTRHYVDVVIVVDDGSRDKTAEIACEAGAIVISHEQNCGKGVALNTGFQKAREFNPAVVVTLDADWQHEPEQICGVIAPILSGEADIVVGSRYLVNTSDVPLQRVLGHQFFNSLLSTTSGVSLTDSQSGFRAFSTHAVNEITFSSSSFAVEAEMQFLAKELHLRTLEVPITIRYTDKPKRSVFKHGLIVLDGIMRLVSQRRPLLYFSSIGFLALLFGSLSGIWTLTNFDPTLLTALGAMLVFILFMLFGLLSVFTGIILHAIRLLMVEYRQI